MIRSIQGPIVLLSYRMTQIICTGRIPTKKSLADSAPVRLISAIRDKIILALLVIIFEDIPIGLVPMIAIADKFGVPCDIMKTICKLGNYLLGRELVTTGRTLENLGLTDTAREEFLEFVERG